MKDKILAAFKAKYPTVNLSKARLNAIAAKIETKVIDDETKIDAALDELNNSSILTFAEIAKEDDRVRNLEAKSKQTATPPKDEKESKEATPPIDENTPEYVKTMMAGIQSLQQTVAQLQGEKNQSVINTTLESKLPNVPKSYWEDWSLPTKPEDVDSFVEKVTTKYSSFEQSLVDKGLAIKPPKSGSAGAAGGKETASKEELDSLAKQIL